MVNNNNTLIKANGSFLSNVLKKLSYFFKRKESNDISKLNKNNNTTNRGQFQNHNSFKSELSEEYNELQRLRKIRENYDKNENYIKNISTEDLIKLTEMNKREIQEMENQIKRNQNPV